MKKEIRSLLAGIEDVWTRLGLDDKLTQIAQLDSELADPLIWQDLEKAQNTTREQTKLKKLVEPWQKLKLQLEDLASVSEDEELLDEVESQMTTVRAELAELKKQLLFCGEYDGNNAILRLSAGAGGDDAQDWTEMLERMYLRYAESGGFEAKMIERSAGENAGVKTSVITMRGPFAYGKLRSENGVHRLVRLSPFNAESRETSFARVEVLPELNTPGKVELDDKDLKIDVYRASGHGGQSVNTTDSAVRVTHVPTGIVVSIQNEKSQLKNKETALSILRSKLVALQIEQHAENLSQIKGESQSAAWGQQIRNYVLHPYKLVKDTRTGIEKADVDRVLGGDINIFVDAYLEQNAGLND
ncbi:peptide chain release factor 2 [Candidatus Saccharibacteria bacterium]|nr:peptide chain release factor 2 [Candidatus Saccharibacteria bacterium]